MGSGTVVCPFIGGCSSYFRYSLSPCLQMGLRLYSLRSKPCHPYRRPTLEMGTPLRELSNLSSPPNGLFERTMPRESASLGKLSRISERASDQLEAWKVLRGLAWNTFESNSVNWVSGATDNLNCPFRLSNLSVIAAEAGMLNSDVRENDGRPRSFTQNSV